MVGCSDLCPADRSQLVGRLDWAGDEVRLLETLYEERLGWDDPWLASLDLEYHNINPDQGLPGLEAEGKTFASPATATSRARTRRTERRGGIRGLCVRRFRDQIKSVQWERVQFKGMLIPKVLEMGDLFEPEKELSYILETAVSPAEAIEAWDQRKEYAP